MSFSCWPVILLCVAAHVAGPSVAWVAQDGARRVVVLSDLSIFSLRLPLCCGWGVLPDRLKPGGGRDGQSNERSRWCLRAGKRAWNKGAVGAVYRAPMGMFMMSRVGVQLVPARFSAGRLVPRLSNIKMPEMVPVKRAKTGSSAMFRVCFCSLWIRGEMTNHIQQSSDDQSRRMKHRACGHLQLAQASRLATQQTQL